MLIPGTSRATYGWGRPAALFCVLLVDSGPRLEVELELELAGTVPVTDEELD